MRARGAGLSPAPRFAGLTATLVALLATGGCNTAAKLGPEPSDPPRAASSNDFAVEVEFPVPLDRASASDPGRFTVLDDASSPVAIYSAQLADTIFGRVVLLLLSGGPLADSARYTVLTSGMKDVFGAPLPDGRAEFRAGLRYGTDIAPLFAAHCDGCHGSARADGSYRTDSLEGLFGAGTDGTPDLIVGDANCSLVRRTRPQKSMYDRGSLDPLEADIIQNWVVSYQARP